MVWCLVVVRDVALHGSMDMAICKRVNIAGSRQPKIYRQTVTGEKYDSESVNNEIVTGEPEKPKLESTVN